MSTSAAGGGPGPGPNFQFRVWLVPGIAWGGHLLLDRHAPLCNPLHSLMPCMPCTACLVPHATCQ